MKKIKSKISWSGKNFCATNDSEIDGCIIVTAKTFEDVKKEFAESLAFHIKGMIKDGDFVPEWLSAGRYEIVYTFEVSALLRYAETYTSISAISRVSGINQKSLSHYANARRIPRANQQQRIINALHKIGKELSVV